MRKAGQPKKFKSGDKLIDLWREFCNYIIENDYSIVPTQTEFCNWLALTQNSVDRKTIYNSLNIYFPTIKKEFERIQSDIIMQGGMLGKYQPTMCIFGLKNWCSWADTKKEESTDEKVTVIIDV